MFFTRQDEDNCDIKDNRADRTSLRVTRKEEGGRGGRREHEPGQDMVRFGKEKRSTLPASINTNHQNRPTDNVRRDHQ